MNTLIILVQLFLINGYWMYVHDSGPQIIPSVGKVWPKPKYERGCSVPHFIDPNNFTILVIGKTCDILEIAIARYMEIIKLSVNSLIHDSPKEFDKSKLVKNVLVNLTAPCGRYPHLNMDEWYNLEGTGLIFANSIWGILRGLETYSQLLIPTSNGMLQISDIRINDSPRFSHRGLMLDTARHYINVKSIMTILDGMAYNKLNVFHWHIVDDESFPYQSIKFPELSERGAFISSMIYTQDNITNIIEYARLRGIRVIFEFDIPAHTKSWAYSHPDIILECGIKSGQFGTINPISETAFSFLEVLFTEIISVGKDQFLHIGGNDVHVDCWDGDNRIYQYSRLHQAKYVDIYNSFMIRIADLIAQKASTVIIWDEGLLASKDTAFIDKELPPGSTVQVKLKDWKTLLNRITTAGYRVILSECWNLDQLSLNDNWDNYLCEPHDFNGTLTQKKLVIGGEAYIWSKFIGDRNIVHNIFPKVSITAERLWSQRSVRNITDAQERLEEHLCRMILRGIPAQPFLGPGFCG